MSTLAANKESRQRQTKDELTASEAAETGLEHIRSLTNKETLSATEVSPTDEGWLVGVEVLEEQRIPSSSDLLGGYELQLDLSGELLSYRRTRRYVRGKGDGGGAT